MVAEPGTAHADTERSPSHLDGYFDLQYYDQFLQDRQTHFVSKLRFALRPSNVVRFTKRLGYACIPQLARSLIWDDQAPASKVFPTSYLNGLRGITAVKVFTFHYTFAYGDFGFQPYGSDARHHYFLELPIVRYFYAGFTSHIFFGIAGYLTSLRLFQLLDKNDTASQSKVLINVSGAMFRRAFRLYLPVFLITLITATYIYLGFYEFNRPLLLDHPKYFPGEWNEPKPDQLKSYWEQVQFWYREMLDLSNILSENTFYPMHDQHLWSIQSEMRASLHLYGILIATALCRKQVRLIVMLALTFLYFLWNHWEIWVYILGAIVAQVDLLLTEKDQIEKETLKLVKVPSNPPVTTTVRRRSSASVHVTPKVSKPLREWPVVRTQSLKHDALIRSGARFLAFLLAFYFLSYPIDSARGDYSPGYMTLNLIIPEWMVRKDKFYPNIGTAMLLLLLARSDPATSRWRRLLTSPVPQYLGRISFALYLVHGPIMHMFGYLIPHQIWWSFGKEGTDVPDVPWALTIVIGWGITLIASLAAADVWTREVEGRCVKIVKKLEDVAFVKKSS